jgi:murein DD-endopeptidase MepM/ murein hydrolase activator NlpD
VKEPLEAGQRVASGDRIGRVGSTGTSTGPHLHYEVIIDDRPVPPLTDGSPLAVVRKTSSDEDEHDLMSSVRNKFARALEAKSALPR